ncbi:ROK family protein [Corallococcus sp. BB11-1]|uniref:ROK family protein n=1 Tax=Corallococcus sp. BB11-1 TaxID=2996783 RepID=UPI00226E0535|nr:ROK family protein [Corallococcus sp. BB11-1]MCY1032966.1 ROK family protein [Corallococcus sp. BB11-1]
MTSVQWSPRRHHPPGITPLEVWNLPVSGRELWEVLGSPWVEEDRRAGVPGTTLTARLMPALAEALALLVTRHAPDAAYLSGGLAELDGFQAALKEATATLPCPVYIAPTPRFAPVHAGLRMLEAQGFNTPVCVDVGQTSIKCARPGSTRVFERDLTHLPPLFIGQPRPRDGHHIRDTVAFIADALNTFLTEDPRTAPDALCLALPCPLDEDLEPGGCTYGFEGAASLVSDILARAGLPEAGGPVFVLNDAELAAESARRDARVTGQRVLCLSLGFGPGGALLDPG